MDEFTTEFDFDSHAWWAIDVFVSFVDMLSMGVCTTRHFILLFECQNNIMASQENEECAEVPSF